MADIRTAIYQLLEAEQPMTVRQVFYRLVSLGAIRKTETEYKATVCRLLSEMRRDGSIPFGWIADNTRWMRKPSTFNSLDHILRSAAETYRRATWTNQSVYVEIWLEKDALSGVLWDVTSEWDVPLMVTRGYPSLSFLYEAAAAIRQRQRSVYLYYPGDHDPSGVDIPRKVEADLREFATGAEIHFERIAVQPWQIEEWHLPTRPTKQSDSRSSSFEGESVEVDAIPPQKLREMVGERITRHIDYHAYNQLLRIENQERKTLDEIVDQLGGTA
jgi:hypothetical protein